MISIIVFIFVFLVLVIISVCVQDSGKTGEDEKQRPASRRTDEYDSDLTDSDSDYDPELYGDMNADNDEFFRKKAEFSDDPADVYDRFQDGRADKSDIELLMEDDDIRREFGEDEIF